MLVTAMSPDNQLHRKRLTSFFEKKKDKHKEKIKETERTRGLTIVIRPFRPVTKFWPLAGAVAVSIMPANSTRLRPKEQADPAVCCHACWAFMQTYQH